LIALMVEADDMDGDAIQPRPTACSPWCLVDYADPDRRLWKHCTHRRRTT
jgi:hypothetical protein